MGVAGVETGTETGVVGAETGTVVVAVTVAVEKLEDIVLDPQYLYPYLVRPGILKNMISCPLFDYCLIKRYLK